KLSDSTDTEYGLGFELLNGSDMEVTGSTGVGVGYNAANLQFSNTRATIIVLTNTTNGKSALLAKEINEWLWKGQSRELHAPKDSLDQLVWSVIAKGSKGTVDTGDFADHDAAERFKGSIPFIQAAGKLQSVENKGEKLNPENTARRYFITFEKGGTSWVFIFSKGKKILVANHM
ncbi:MAG TPA: hypothetical protein VGR89_13765, partial [Puia sp.]|nr:hypothetical protein [Puia sp.]